MKMVYIVHVVGEKKSVEPILLFDMDSDDFLNKNILERIFEIHNLAREKRLPSLTGYPDFVPMKDYVVDVDNFVVWSCEPIGWRRVNFDIHIARNYTKTLSDIVHGLKILLSYKIAIFLDG